jgi:RimJ/RimL family protein N-acetyltransferase
MHRGSAMRPAVLTTQRLHLRPRTMADLEACLAMDLDPDVHRFIDSQPPDPAERRAQLRARIADGWPTSGGIWVVEWQDAPGFLGWCGLFPLEDSGLIEIGYRYVPGAWGRGIATEAARAVLDHGFRSLGFDPIVAVTHPANLASQHVLAKIGLTACGSAFYYGHWLRFFHLSRAAYLSAEPGPTGSTASPGPMRP